MSSSSSTNNNNTRPTTTTVRKTCPHLVCDFWQHRHPKIPNHHQCTLWCCELRASRLPLHPLTPFHSFTPLHSPAMDVEGEAERAVLLHQLSTPWRKDVLPFAALHVAALSLAVHLVLLEHINWHLLLLTAAALATLQAVAFLSSTWSVAARAFFQFSETASLDTATHVLVHPTDKALKPEICPIVRERAPASDEHGGARCTISFQRLPYVLSQPQGPRTPVACDIVHYPTTSHLKQYRCDPARVSVCLCSACVRPLHGVHVLAALFRVRDSARKLQSSP